MLRVSLAEQSDQNRWDAYALNHPDASPYHMFAWKQAVEGSYGHTCPYLCAEKNGELVGILPLVHIHILGIVGELAALPYCDVGSCLCDDDEVQDALLDEAMKIQKKLNCKKLTLRGQLRDSALKTEFGAEAHGKVRMLLPLPPSSDELISGFKSKLRSQIRKAEKNGISFRWSGLDELDAVWSVFSRNMHDLGSPVHAKNWIRSVLQNYKERARVGLAEYGGETVGIGIVLMTNTVVSIPWASCLREFNHLAPNVLLYWNLLKFSSDNGYQVFDFGRSTEGEGTYKFKKQWGAEPMALAWHSHPDARKCGGRARLHSSNRDVAARLWRKIPLPIANFLGPHLRKYISL